MPVYFFTLNIIDERFRKLRESDLNFQSRRLNEVQVTVKCMGVAGSALPGSAKSKQVSLAHNGLEE
jgi:hypothetical protein